MTAVYVIRHPETTWNAAQRYQGRLDAPLSGEGRQQAQESCRAFAGHHLDAIYTSPLRRARDLAEELAAVTGAPLSTDHRLTEVGQCPWEGLHLPEIKARFPDLYERWYVHPDLVRFPGGEDLRDVQRRGRSALADVFRRHPGGHVALVTHSVVIMSMVAAAVRLDLEHLHRLRISNSGVTTLCGTEPPGSLLTLNDVCGVYGSPVASAMAQDCVRWKLRRVTQ